MLLLLLNLRLLCSLNLSLIAFYCSAPPSLALFAAADQNGKDPYNWEYCAEQAMSVVGTVVITSVFNSIRYGKIVPFIISVWHIRCGNIHREFFTWDSLISVPFSSPFLVFFPLLFSPVSAIRVASISPLFTLFRGPVSPRLSVTHSPLGLLLFGIIYLSLLLFLPGRSGVGRGGVELFPRIGKVIDWHNIRSGIIVWIEEFVLQCHWSIRNISKVINA